MHASQHCVARITRSTHTHPCGALHQARSTSRTEPHLKGWRLGLLRSRAFRQRSDCHSDHSLKFLATFVTPRRTHRDKVRLSLSLGVPCCSPFQGIICLQLCVRNCEPRSYHERPHTYVHNPPTPELRVALATDPAAKTNQGQTPDHPEGLDAL